MKQATKDALALVVAGKTHYMAAKMSGIAQSTVKRAIERERFKCDTCGAYVRDTK